jgi:hypothetical protein
MGVVYLATAPSGAPVAVKVVRAELTAIPGFRDRFRREVVLARRVTGPHAVAIVDADPDGPVPYLVTELVPGENLEQRVARTGPLTGDELTGLAGGLAAALVAMGAAGVVHRDLKPANVLMGGAGPKVIDFGISRAVDEPSATQTGVVRGSPMWMAPEQALGLPVTAGSDVFAWGALVAFASSGRPPFGSGRSDAVLYRVVHEAPDLRDVDPAVAPLVAAALAKDPARRPPARYLAGVLAAPAAGTGPPGDRAPAVGPAPLLPPLPPPSARSTAQPASRRGRPVRRALAGLAAALVLLAAGTGAVVAVRHADHGGGASDKEAGRVRSGRETTAPATVSVDLPLVACPSDGVDDGAAPVDLPPTVSTAVPSTLVRRLAVYTDPAGQDRVLGPAGWSCAATQAPDGSTSVAVYPAGGSPPRTDGSGTPGDSRAVVLTDSGTCTGCALSTASPLFPAAAAACAEQFLLATGSCPTAPVGEQHSTLSSTVVAFTDPTGVAGTGIPSGGSDPAVGAMAFLSGSDPETWLETCTLPSASGAICAAVVHGFVATYGG